MRWPHYKSFKIIGLALVCGLLSFFSGSGVAGTASTSVEVSATVYSLCVVSTTPAATMNFLPLTSASQDFPGPTISVTCTKGASALISIESGLNDANASSGAAHALTDGNGNFINYDTYRDSNRNQVWGSVVSGNTLSATADGTSHDYPIYIRVPGGQNTLPNGHYSDTLTIDVSY